MSGWRIDIESAAGVVLGDGPITNATSWSSTARMDRGGVFAFSLLASDPKADLVATGNVARCYALIGGAWQEIGAGVIDHIERSVQADGSVEVAASGGDLVASLANRSMQNWAYGVGGTVPTLADVLADITTDKFGYDAPDWTFVPDPAPPTDGFYGRFSFETTLAALRMIAERSQTHFYYSGRNEITFASTFPASGVRAIRPLGDLGASTCAITDLRQIEDSFDVCSILYAFGGGNGDARLTLLPSTRVAPYPYYKTSTALAYGVVSYLRYLGGAHPTYGTREIAVQWKDIYPLSSTDADVEAAANALFDQALHYMEQHTEPQQFYSLSVAGCSQVLRPMQSIRVAFRDVAAGLEIDEDLYILETTVECGADGPQTVGLLVSTVDRYPDTDASAVATRLASGTIYQAHPQVDHNGYVISYTKSLDDAETAVFRFRFDEEVLRLIRCTFDFQLLPLESTVKSVAGSELTTPAGGGSTTVSGGGSTTVSGGGGTTPSGGGTTTPTGEGGTSVSVAASTSDSGSGHTHEINLANSTSGTAVYFAGTGSPPTGDFRTSGGGKVNTSSTGSGHTHSIPGHSHTIPSHQHTVPNHTHSTPNHQHDTPNHSHATPNHQHTFTPTITATYGIFRDSAGNTFGLTDLEYSVDGSTWYGFSVGVNGFTTLGDGWYRVDLTALLQDSVTYRPLASNNALHVRRKSTGAIKQATIDAQMNIRTQIQSLALS